MIAEFASCLRMANLDGSLVYVFNNQTGNVEALYKADSSNELLAEYEYTPFGETRRQSGELAEKNPLRYSTRYHEGNTGLYYYGFRHYSPVTKKWLSQDPLEENGGLNLYRFASNNPINIIDILGLCEDCEITIDLSHGTSGNGSELERMATESTSDEKRNADPSKLSYPVGCYSGLVADRVRSKPGHAGSIPNNFSGSNKPLYTKSGGKNDFDSDGDPRFLPYLLDGLLMAMGIMDDRGADRFNTAIDRAIDDAMQEAMALCQGKKLPNGKTCKSIKMNIRGGDEINDDGISGKLYLKNTPGLNKRINKANKKLEKECSKQK